MSAGHVEGLPDMIRRLWPKTWTGWILAVLVLLTFFTLDVLALLGSELATGLLISLAGILVGAAVAWAAAYPLRDRLSSSGGWRMVGIFLGLASVFLILVVGSTLAGIPKYPTAAGGEVGSLIYGLAFGFGIGFLGRLGPARRVPAAGDRPGRSPELTLVVVAAVAVAALFSLAFAAYVVFEFVVGPVARYFA